MWTKGDVTLRVYISCCYVGRFACRDIWALLYKILWLGICLRICCKWTYKGAKINTLGETVTVAFPAWSAALLSRKQLLAFFQWTTWYVATGLLMKSRHNTIHYFCDVHVPLCSLCIVRILILLFNEERLKSTVWKLELVSFNGESGLCLVTYHTKSILKGYLQSMLWWFGLKKSKSLNSFCLDTDWSSFQKCWVWSQVPLFLLKHNEYPCSRFNLEEDFGKHKKVLGPLVLKSVYFTPLF